MQRRLVTLFLALAMLLPLSAMSALAAGGTGQLTVIHGIPGVTVDVWANGSPLLPSFEPETVTDPVELPSGTYDVVITTEGGDPGTPADVVLEGSVELAPGANVSVIAHLSEAGAPTLTAFGNDASPIVGNNARLTVRHTAAAPAVDVRAGGSPIIESIANPESATLEVPAGSYDVDLTLPGMSDAIFDAGTLDLETGNHYIVYAFGDFVGGTFGLLIQVIGGLNLPTDGFGVVNVVHGVPGLVVDVYLNGGLAIEDFQPSAVAGPILLPATGYDIAIYAADSDPLVDKPAIEGYADLPVGANVNIVAYLATPGPTPELGVFVNDVSEIADGETRLSVRHVANAPTVDVYANGGELVPDLANGAEAVADVPEGTYDVELYADGTTPDDSEPAFDAGELAVAAGTNYLIHAIGTLGTDFELIIQAIPGLGPDGAFSDTAGSVHDEAINALAQAGVVFGKTDGSYGTNDSITRGQLASIIARSLSLSSDVDAFSDDDGSVHEDAINAIAAVGITQGRADGTFGPNDPITRAQSASFIARALGLSGGPDAFPDDDGSVHEDAINALAAAGIAEGKADGTFGPDDLLGRGQMASLWARGLGISS